MPKQDAFGRRKASLRESFVKTGWIRTEEIIPARKFCQNRMNSVGGKHPCEKVLSKQDEFGWRKSSLRESFVKTGCIRPAEIIPGREFRQNRMHSVSGNHPCEKMMSKQDEFRRRKSLELRECKENTGVGWNPKFQFEGVTSTFAWIATESSIFSLRATVHLILKRL